MPLIKHNCLESQTPGIGDTGKLVLLHECDTQLRVVGPSAAGHGGLSKRHFHKHCTEILNLEVGERTLKTFSSHEPFLKL